MAKDLIQRIEWLENRLEQTQQQMQAQQHLLTWMLTLLPEQNVQSFLDKWKEECRGKPLLDEDVALISALNEDLTQLRGEHASAQDR